VNPIAEEVSKQVGGFMDIMRSQPLSLALVLMNVGLIVFLFYSQSQTLTQRQHALDQIVQWQRDTDRLMAGCISKEALELVLNAVLRNPLTTPIIPVPVPSVPDGFKLQSDESRPLTDEERQNLFRMPP
jgi:hypothetical protein